jgi:hypothetical protein
MQAFAAEAFLAANPSAAPIMPVGTKAKQKRALHHLVPPGLAHPVGKMTTLILGPNALQLWQSTGAGAGGSIEALAPFINLPARSVHAPSQRSSVLGL